MTPRNPARITSGKRGLLVLVALAGLGVMAGLMATQAIGAHSTQHGLSRKVVACERRGTMICDRAAHAADHFPLAKPDPRTTGKAGSSGLLNEQGVLAALGWTGDTIGASEMTYAKAQSNYPTLAGESSAVFVPSREVWVVTRYFNPPVTAPANGGWGPSGAPQGNVQYSSLTVIVDAATGTETDACPGCSYIPADGG